MDEFLIPLSELYRLTTEDMRRSLREAGGGELRLSGETIDRLLLGRTEALRAAGRVEFGGGVLPKLLYAFRSSPYLAPEDAEETLAALQEMFYACQNDLRGRWTDDELIEYMAGTFNGRAHGSLDYLTGALEELGRGRAGDAP